ncbi:helix-turn-helix transcriptional regulator [Flavobacterium humi]|uniref:AraC family transcriptional regulator n=1 Tax=Flavobacterium humi TaxID=2562683 RepID=A0A4Z0LCX6_9FLAO|nr:helix-turn-helix transcriptional regulator [Flavobacterium humi]TGD59713.1 AraC family transcriptional regulator [Flavobacterium humi]
MRFETIQPAERLKPYIKHLVISENAEKQVYKIFPSTGLVIGFQYRGSLALLKDNQQNNLSSAGITGISDTFKVFSNSANIGTILVFFTEIGLAHFASCPANELFNQSLSLDAIFNKQFINDTEEKLSAAITDRQRLHIVEQFLLSQLKNIHQDKLIMEGVKLIYQTKGAIRIKELNEKLGTSQSPFEKRFRKIVGTTPKKFSSIVRFNTVLQELDSPKTLTDICYENNFFDQAHFSKDFKQYTGEAPENFKRHL